MATDRFGIQEQAEGVSPDFVRFDWRNRIAFDPDPRIHFGSGRLSPVDGSPLTGYFARFRDQDGNPIDMAPDWWMEG